MSAKGQLDHFTPKPGTSTIIATPAGSATTLTITGVPNTGRHVLRLTNIGTVTLFVAFGAPPDTADVTKHMPIAPMEYLEVPIGAGTTVYGVIGLAGSSLYGTLGTSGT